MGKSEAHTTFDDSDVSDLPEDCVEQLRPNGRRGPRADARRVLSLFGLKSDNNFIRFIRFDGKPVTLGYGLSTIDFRYPYKAGLPYTFILIIEALLIFEISR